MQGTVTSATHKGHRPYQEDRFVVHNHSEGLLLAVMDGHGGVFTSDLLSKSLVSAWDMLDWKISEAAAEVQVKGLFTYLAGKTNEYAEGSTMSLAWIPKNGDYATCAVLGDSPIVGISESDTFVSVEHNVRTNEKEAEAVRQRGGYIANGYAMVGHGGYGLQMARAFGDAHLAQILSRDPDVFTLTLANYQYLLVASDGVFDPGHEDFDASLAIVTQLVRNGATAQQIVDNAYKRRTFDNATALLFKVENAVSQ